MRHEMSMENNGRSVLGGTHKSPFLSKRNLSSKIKSRNTEWPFTCGNPLEKLCGFHGIRLTRTCSSSFPNLSKLGIKALASSAFSGSRFAKLASSYGWRPLVERTFRTDAIVSRFLKALNLCVYVWVFKKMFESSPSCENEYILHRWELTATIKASYNVICGFILRLSGFQKHIDFRVQQRFSRLKFL